MTSPVEQVVEPVVVVDDHIEPIKVSLSENKWIQF